MSSRFDTARIASPGAPPVPGMEGEALNCPQFQYHVLFNDSKGRERWLIWKDSFEKLPRLANTPATSWRLRSMCQESRMLKS